MQVDFESLSDQAKIWIYQSDRPLSESEIEYIEKNGRIFIEQWTAHGNDLKGALKTFYNQFLILGVDENHNAASGCSIDASVHFLKELEQSLGVNFFDRSKVAFLKNDSVHLENFNKIKERIQEGKIDAEQKTFNNHIASKAQFDTGWITEAGQSWMAKYF